MQGFYKSNKPRTNWANPFEDLFKNLIHLNRYPQDLSLFDSGGNVSKYLQALKALKHADYLKTPHWSWLRREALDKANYRCQICNSKKSLEVHHRTYEHIPNEDDHNDLVALCNACHAHFHERLPKQASEEDQ